jgi:hypothetical protein
MLNDKDNKYRYEFRKYLYTESSGQIFTTAAQCREIPD